MKLVDILARGLKVWPEGVLSLSQLQRNGAIINGKGYDGREWARFQIAEDTQPAGVLVTEAQWRAAVDALKAEKEEEKVMTIDWSKAPEGFDFHFRAKRSSRADEGAFYQATKGGRFVNERGSYISYTDMHEITGLFVMTVRPQVVEWTGEGRPPAGTVCEFNDGCGGGYKKVEIMYVSTMTILVKFDGSPDEDVEGAYSPNESLYFRPIRTPEQIAAEECDKAVKAMLAEFEHTGSLTSHYEVCEVLHKAGYRKFEIVEGE